MKVKACRPLGCEKKTLKVVTITAALALAMFALAGCASSNPSGESGTPNGLWEWFCQFVASIVEAFYWPVHDWGMAIILVTIVFRLLISPLMHKQTKSNYQMQKVQPLISEIQARYADDPVRQNEELRKVYADAKFNPLAGCIPMLLQMPIFIALFQVLRNIDTFIPSVDNFRFYGIVPDLLKAPSDMFQVGIAEFIPYLILMLIFAVATFLPMILQQKNNKNGQNQMIWISLFMMVMMLWISWGSPAGVLLFWGVSSVIGIAQQQITQHILKKRDEEEAAQVIDTKPVEVSVERKVKKKRPTKKR